MDFYRYDVAADSWTQLADLPAGGLHGSDIDPVHGEYVTFGPGGDSFTWRVSVACSAMRPPGDGSTSLTRLPGRMMLPCPRR